MTKSLTHLLVVLLAVAAASSLSLHQRSRRESPLGIGAAEAKAPVKDLRMPSGLVIHPVVVQHGPDGTGEVRLEVRKPDGTLLQTLATKGSSLIGADQQPAITFPDFNFDGHADIYFKESFSSGGNILGRVWLFDPSSGKFVLNEDLGELTTLKVDARHHRLTTESRGFAGAGYTKQVLEWQDGHPVVVREEEQHPYTQTANRDVLVVRRTIKERSLGSLRTTEEIILTITLNPWGKEKVISRKTF